MNRFIPKNHGLPSGDFSFSVSPSYHERRRNILNGFTFATLMADSPGTKANSRKAANCTAGVNDRIRSLFTLIYDSPRSSHWGFLTFLLEQSSARNSPISLRKIWYP